MDLEFVRNKVKDKILFNKKFPEKFIAKSILAGMYISFGAFLMGYLQSYDYNKLLCSSAFSIGLLLVVVANGELFTGNCLLGAFVSDEEDAISIPRLLFSNYIGNLIGSIFVFILIIGTGMNNLDIFSEIAKNKCSYNIAELFFRGLFCNILVCLAVWVANYSNLANNVSNKFIAVLLPVTMFIFCGFEHSIANMFFLLFGLYSHSITIGQACIQLLVVTIGNYIGGKIISILIFETLFDKE